MIKCGRNCVSPSAGKTCCSGANGIGTMCDSSMKCCDGKCVGPSEHCTMMEKHAAEVAQRLPELRKFVADSQAYHSAQSSQFGAGVAGAGALCEQSKSMQAGQPPA